MYRKIWFGEFKSTALSTGSEMIVLSSRSHFNYQIINTEEIAGYFYDSKARVGFAISFIEKLQDDATSRGRCRIQSCYKICLKNTNKTVSRGTCNGFES